MGTFQTALWWSVAIPIAYLLATYLLAAARRITASDSQRVNVAPEDHAALAHSRFTIPVSLIVNVDNDALNVQASIRSLLELDYPQIEVILVTDATQTRLIQLLKPEFDLTPRQLFYRCSLPGPAVRAIYISAVDSRLVVVDQPRSDTASAWNCGINLARNRYVGIVPAGRFCRPDALLSAMGPANADPGGVVAILGDLGARDRRGSERRVTRERRVAPARRRLSLAGFENLARLRTTRVSLYAPLDIGAIDSPEAFGLWRRDAVVDAGGFVAGGTGTGLDLALRLRAGGSGQDVARRVLVMAVGGHGDDRRALADTIQKRARCCQALLETTWRRRWVPGIPPGALKGVFGTLIPALLESWLLAALPASVIVGGFQFATAAMLAALVAFGKGCATNAALLASAGNPPAEWRPALLKICLGVLEFPVYRPVTVVAGLIGIGRFLAFSPLPSRHRTV